MMRINTFADQIMNNEHINNTEYTSDKYVVGLIVGSVSSVFPFACVNSQIDIKDHPGTIQFAGSWPGQRNNPCFKIPTLIYLNDKKEVTNKIGVKAKTAYEKPKSSGILLRNFISSLCRSYDPKIDDGTMKHMTQLDIVNAITNFLQIFYKNGFSEMKRLVSKSIREPSSICHVVTVPHTWSRKKRDAYKDVVMQANLVPKDIFDSAFMFISDTQAAALYCETYFDCFQMDIGRSFMVLHAGGTTTKISVFTIVESTELENDPLMVELVPSVEINRGSSDLIAAFRDLILRKFERCRIQINKVSEIESIVSQFSDAIKDKFLPRGDIQFAIPSSMKLRSDFDDPNGPIIDGKLIVTNDEMKNIILSPVVSPILCLIEKTLFSLPENKRDLDNLFVVGDFGESPYLFGEIIKRFQGRGFRTGSIKYSPEGGFAVAKGAVSYGIKPRLIPSDSLRHTYGLDITNIEGDGFYFQEDKAIYNSNEATESIKFYNKIKKRSLEFENYDDYALNVTVQHPGSLEFALYPPNRETYPTLEKGYTLECKIYVNTLDIVDVDVDGNNEVELQIRIETMATHIRFSIIYKNDIISEKKIRCEQSLLLKYKPKEIKAVKRKRSIVEFLRIRR